MAAISTRFGSGGANVAPGKSAGSPTLASALRDVADDLAALKGAALAAPAPGAALAAFTDPPSAAEMAALRSRVNELIVANAELRTIQTARNGVTILTTKA